MLLVTIAVSSFVSAAADTAFCQALTSLELAKSKILPAASADIRPRTPLISFCTVQLRTLWQLSVSLRPLVQSLGVVRLLGLHGLSPSPHSLEGVG